MIAAVASPGPFLNILRVQNLRGGELEVPVSPVQYAYARFEHLRGVPSPEGGISLFKLRVLDNLIDRLLAEGQPVPEAARRPGLEPARAEILIGELGGRLRQRLGILTALPGGFRTQTGMLFELVA
jgi:hypothetical protein